MQSKTESSIPADSNVLDISILVKGKQVSRKLYYKSWDPAQRKKRALKKTGKIVGTIMAVSSIGLFVHILLIVILPLLLATLLISIPLYFKFANEKANFYAVDGPCPKCKSNEKFRPYLDSQLNDEITIQCGACGDTLKASIG